MRSEKGSSIDFQEIKAKPGTRQTNNLSNNLTKQKDASNKDRWNHSTNKILQEQEQQQQQQQSSTSQSNSKEKPSHDAVNEMLTNNMKKKLFIIADSIIEKVDGYLLTNSLKNKYHI